MARTTIHDTAYEMACAGKTQDEIADWVFEALEEERTDQDGDTIPGKEAEHTDLAEEIADEAVFRAADSLDYQRTREEAYNNWRKS